MRCQEKDDYEKRLAKLIAEGTCRMYVPRVATVDVLEFGKNLGCLYFNFDVLYRPGEHSPETLVCERQIVFVWW